MASEVVDITLPKNAGQLVNNEKFAKAIDLAVPRGVSGARLLRQMQTAVNRSEQLQKCSVVSLRDCLMDVAQLGLDLTPVLGHAYLVPFGQTCTLIVGYMGLIELMYRSGKVKSVRAVAVFKGDAFSYEYGLHEDIQHKPCGNTEPKDLTHVYCVIRMEGTDPIWRVLTVDECDRIRARSRSKDTGPWKTDYVAMCLKTGVRQTSKWAPKLAEVSEAFEREETQAHPDFIPAEFSQVDPAAASAPDATAARVTARLDPQGSKKRRQQQAAAPQQEPAQEAVGEAESSGEGEGPTEELAPQEEAPEEDQGKISEEDFRKVVTAEIEALMGKMGAATRLVARQKWLKDKPLSSYSAQHLSLILDGLTDLLNRKPGDGLGR